VVGVVGAALEQLPGALDVGGEAGKEGAEDLDAVGRQAAVEPLGGLAAGLLLLAVVAQGLAVGVAPEDGAAGRGPRPWQFVHSGEPVLGPLLDAEPVERPPGLAGGQHLGLPPAW